MKCLYNLIFVIVCALALVSADDCDKAYKKYKDTMSGKNIEQCVKRARAKHTSVCLESSRCTIISLPKELEDCDVAKNDKAMFKELKEILSGSLCENANSGSNDNSNIILNLN
ncbi:hypothetical protein U3516DRAFT_831505 [Neocallimastix sp. 'constans']